LTGKKAVRVHGIVRTFKTQTSTINGIRQITAPDYCCFQMELESGILVSVNLQSDRCCRTAYEQDVSIIGEDGSLIVVGGDLICLRKKQNPDTTLYEVKEEKLYMEIQDMRNESPTTTLPRPYIKGLTKMIGALKEAFTTSTGWAKEAVSSAANFSDALYVQVVLEAIKQSSDTRSWIKINQDDLQT
jgi:predicted dehydrogenase